MVSRGIGGRHGMGNEEVDGRGKGRKERGRGKAEDGGRVGGVGMVGPGGKGGEEGEEGIGRGRG